MNPLTEQILHHGLSGRVFNDAQLARILGGSDARRYGLVNRACKAGELHRLRRGLYLLDRWFLPSPMHPFTLAQALVPGSYVSFETALAHYGWIPESVHSTASVTPGRKSKDYAHEKLGSFSFHPLAINRGYFLELVVREQTNQQTMLVAKPVRALMDLVCLRKEPWQGLGWLTDGLRIDEEYLHAITLTDIETLKLVYKHKQVKDFLQCLEKELGID